MTRVPRQAMYVNFENSWIELKELVNLTDSWTEWTVLINDSCEVNWLDKWFLLLMNCLENYPVIRTVLLKELFLLVLTCPVISELRDRIWTVLSIWTVYCTVYCLNWFDLSVELLNELCYLVNLILCSACPVNVEFVQVLVNLRNGQSVKLLQLVRQCIDELFLSCLITCENTCA